MICETLWISGLGKNCAKHGPSRTALQSRNGLAALLALLAVSPAMADAPTAREIAAKAPASAWMEVPSDHLLVMTLGSGAQSVIELAPDFAPVHVGNVVALVRAHAFDGGVIDRVQDDFVTQWRVRDEKAALPEGFVARPPQEYSRALGTLVFHPLGSPDSYAPEAGFAESWPVGRGGGSVWLAQCYGAVGVARDAPPDTGNGLELYAINSEAPRQLDLNFAVIGRVLSGMDHLAALPRGDDPMGFYKNKARDVAIRSITLASDLPSGQRPRFEVMRTDSPSFTAYLTAASHRTDSFYVHASTGIALCRVEVPHRRVR